MNSGAAAEFQQWNMVLYSPLCVALAAVRAYREPLFYTATGALMAGWCW